MHTRLLPIALATGLLVSACGGGSNSEPTVTSQPAVSSVTGLPLNCSDYTRISQGAYVGASVPFGTYGTGKPYTSCVNISPTAQGVAFEAKWNTPPNTVNLQEVIYGLKGGYTSSNGVLPRKASDITSLTVSYDAQVTVAQGIGDLSVESWLTTGPTAGCLTPQCGVMVELFVNLQTNWNPDYRGLPIVTVDGRDWYMRAGSTKETNATSVTNTYAEPKPNGGTFQFHVSFLPVVNLPNQAQVDMKKFYTYLVSANILPDTLYFSNVEFMLESNGGAGQLRVDNLVIEVK